MSNSKQPKQQLMPHASPDALARRQADMKAMEEWMEQQNSAPIDRGELKTIAPSEPLPMIANGAEATWAPARAERDQRMAVLDASYNKVEPTPERTSPMSNPKPYSPPKSRGYFTGMNGEVDVMNVLLAVILTIVCFPLVMAFINFASRGGQPWVPGMN